MPGRASVECDSRCMPGITRATCAASSGGAGHDLPYELEFFEEPTGGTIDTPLFDLKQVVEAQDPGAILLPTISTGFSRLALHA